MILRRPAPKAISLALAMTLLTAASACSDNNANNTPTDRCDSGSRCITPDMRSEDMSKDMPKMQDMANMKPTALEIPTGCNPIAYEIDCMLPFPSDVFLVDDATMPSGKRVELSNRAKPIARGEAIDFYKAYPTDGYSQHMPILAHFPQGVSTDNLVFHTQDPAPTLTPTNTTLIIDTQTKTLVKHWAEIDQNTEDETKRALIVRPLNRLDERRRYIVVFQGLKDLNGDPIEAPQGFKQLRDGQANEDPTLGPLATRYEAEIFPLLKELGVERAGVTLAWDFTTKSNEHAQRNLFKIRDELIARYSATPPKVTIVNTIEAPSDKIALRVEGTITVPLYMESAKAGAKLIYDEQGRVTTKEDAEVPFTIQVPYSAMPEADGFTPARLMQYGHGFFGEREEINYNFMRGFSEERGFITAAVDWWGMSSDDIAGALSALSSNINDTFVFTDRVHQGIANQIALSYALLGPLAQAPELKRFDKLLYDKDQLYYYGISQGHIFGSTFVPLSPHIDRAVFSVGGVSYSFMMSRSRNFAPFLSTIKRSLASPVDIQKFIAMSQNPFDRVDPLMYTDHLIKSSLPQSPAERKILMQIGLGDAQVNNLTAYLQARASKVPILEPSPIKVWDVETTVAPASIAMVLVDFGIDPLPGLYSKTPKDETPAHEGVRNQDALKEQLDQFLRPDGTIKNFCDGPCDPQ